MINTKMQLNSGVDWNLSMSVYTLNRIAMKFNWTVNFRFKQHSDLFPACSTFTDVKQCPEEVILRFEPITGGRGVHYL